MTLLERTIPVYQFHERHIRTIAAPPAAVWAALREVTLADLALTRALVAVRRLGSGAPAGPPRPLLTDGPLALLSLEPGYALGGAIARPWQRRPEHRDPHTVQEFAAFTEPGWTKYLTDFEVTPHRDGALLRTETRGYSTSDAARRRFAAYWALIRPGSGLVRRDLLATVARRAIAAGYAGDAGDPGDPGDD